MDRLILDVDKVETLQILARISNLSESQMTLHFANTEIHDLNVSPTFSAK